jgi:hypothetical protein
MQLSKWSSRIHLSNERSFSQFVIPSGARNLLLDGAGKEQIPHRLKPGRNDNSLKVDQQWGPNRGSHSNSAKTFPPSLARQESRRSSEKFDAARVRAPN